MANSDALSKHKKNDVAPNAAQVNAEFLRIGEMSEQFDVTLRTLRFYEDKGLIAPKRIGVTRLYSRKDRARVKLILLGKKVGFSLIEVKQLIELYEPGGTNDAQLRATHGKAITQLETLKAQRVAIEEAIEELVSGINIVAERLGAARAEAA